MEITYGNGGWVRVEDGRLPGCMYLRLESNSDTGRWFLTEWYVDGRGEPLSAAALSTVADGLDMNVKAISSELVNAMSKYPGVQEQLTSPGPNLSVLASYFSTRFYKATHWVAESFLAQFPKSMIDVPRPGRARRLPSRAMPPWALEIPVLTPPAQSGVPLRDPEFMASVATAYRRAVALGVRSPAQAIADAAGPGVDKRTVHKWIQVARQEGALDPGVRGRKGG